VEEVVVSRGKVAGIHQDVEVNFRASSQSLEANRLVEVVVGGNEVIALEVLVRR
jgi:hypothetical protein